MRTVIYARYSSHLQNSRSIDGQLADCRERCAREGWTVIAEFQDAAISGAKGIDNAARPGLNALLATVEAGGIDQVLADSTSRIARDEVDAITIRRRIQFAGARLFTLADGEIDDTKGFVKGFLDARQRADLAHNIRRGQRTSVAQGRAPAGIAYGYRQANKIDGRGGIIRGLREIDPDQAEIVRRIFAEFAAGRSPIAIAEALNAEHVPGPRGGPWSVTSIRGDRKRLNGMLVNRLYAGELVVGRTAKVVNPTTRKTVIRPLDRSEWTVQPVPELRIVDQATWQSVQDRIAAAEYTPYRKQQRPKHPLSGLGICSVCGAGWIRITGEKWGCAGRRRGNGCTNTRMIETPRYMAEVMEALRTGLMHPDLAAEYERELREARRERLGMEKQESARLQRRLEESTRKLERLASAIANGAGDVAEIVAMATQLRAERDGYAAKLREFEARKVVPLIAGIAEQYARELANLDKVIAECPDSDIETVPRFRSLIAGIVLTPNPTGRGVTVTVEGSMEAALKLATGDDFEAAMKAVRAQV